MQGQQLKYVGNDFIKQDLRRLKSISSIESDLEAVFKVIKGSVTETSWPPAYDFCGGMITRLEIEGEVFLCFKQRVPTTSPKLSPSNGCRLIYALGIESFTFTPLLLYRANEERKDYTINGKRYSLSSSNLGKIINEKFN